MITILSSKLLFTILLPIIGLYLSYGEAQNERVLLQSISSITLYRGEYTTGRRSTPLPQLECIGGTASGSFSPKAAQCYNRGWDGRDVQWECKAEMPKEYKFGKITVSCEGYDYPNDPYILTGSCGLRYELDYSAKGADKFAYNTLQSTSMPSWFTFEKILSIIVIAFIIYLVYLMLSSDGNAHGNAGGPGGGWGPGYPPDGGRRPPPPPPGWNPPPSYDDATSGGPKPSGSGSSGPGFYSGMGLGALGGYLFGRNWQEGPVAAIITTLAMVVVVFTTVPAPQLHHLAHQLHHLQVALILPQDMAEQAEDKTVKE